MATPSKSNPDPFRRRPTNGLRVDLYKHLLEPIQEQDQRSGAHGYVLNWDDPQAEWDSQNPADTWDAIGFRPVIQSLFYVIESMAGDELGTIESLNDITDPWRCPVDMLPIIAASLGYDLEERVSEETQRQVVSGLVQAFKARGQHIGFRMFYRMSGFRVIRVFPLWKKAVHEDRGRYSRERYATTAVPGEAIGPSGSLAYAGRLSQTPVKPGTLRIDAGGGVVLRDDVDPTGFVSRAVVDLIGPGGETGRVDYHTGEFTVQLVNAAAGSVTADYERVDDEFPMHAARIDIEIMLNPGGVPVPLVDAEVVRNILTRAEETRPVHVLLRTLTLVAEVPDTVRPMASDQSSCATILRRDTRAGSPHLGIQGQVHQWQVDSTIRCAEDVGFIDRVVSGSLARRDYVFEERAPIVCPIDAVLIEGPPGGPFYV